MPHIPRIGRDRPQLTGLITTFNEEENIVACIESLSWCDEILVVDSFSTDRTAEIARSCEKVRFIQHVYHGAASQKNWALQHVRHDWVLLLDADERCTNRLREEIEEILADDPGCNSYTIERDVYFLGKRIRFSGFQHDRVARLFRKGAAYYDVLRVHALLRASGPSPLLRQPMLHFLAEDAHEYIRRLVRYGYWGAAQRWKDGRRAKLFDVAVRPFWRFLRTYFIQLGILDGVHGLVFCLIQAYGTFVKWAVLFGWQLNARRGLEPALPTFEEHGEIWSGIRELMEQDGVRS